MRGPTVCAGLGQLVQPVVLGGARHDQARAVRQIERHPLTPSLGAELEAADRAQREARDHRVPAEAGLVVGVPGDAVAAVAIEVEQLHC